MKISTYIKRLDLLKMQFFLLPRLKANLIFIVIMMISAGIGGIDVLEKLGVIIWLFFTLIVGSVLMFVCFLFGAIVQMLMASAQKGIIGSQKIELSDTHFIEETEGSETKTKWSNIESVYKTKRFMYVVISGLRVHIVPKRDFEFKEDFDKFGNEVIARFKSAKI